MLKAAFRQEKALTSYKPSADTSVRESSSLHPTRLFRGPVSLCWAAPPPPALPPLLEAGNVRPREQRFGVPKRNTSTRQQRHSHTAQMQEPGQSMKSTQQGWNTALVKQKCFALHKQCSALLEHSMNVPDRRGTLSQEKRIRGSSLKLHLSAQEGIQSQANKTAVGATTLPSGAAGNAQLPKADQQRDCKAQGHGPPRGTQQGCSSSTAPLPAPASTQQDTGRGQAKVSRTCRQQPPPAAHGRARHAALVPLTQGRAGAPPRPTFPIKSELPGATASAHHPRPRENGRTEAGGARGTTAASSPPRTHRTRGTAGTEVKRGGGGVGGAPRGTHRRNMRSMSLICRRLNSLNSV